MADSWVSGRIGDKEEVRRLRVALDEVEGWNLKPLKPLKRRENQKTPRHVKLSDICIGIVIWMVVVTSVWKVACYYWSHASSRGVDFLSYETPYLSGTVVLWILVPVFVLLLGVATLSSKAGD